MTGVELVVGALAVYRGTVLVVDDFVFEWLRDWVDWRDDVARRTGRHEAAWSKAGYFVHCPWCVSFWLGVLVTVAAVALEAEWFVALCAPLAFSAVAGVLHRYTHDDPADE